MSQEIQDLMKNPNRDAGLFHLDIGFKDKGLHFANQGGAITSSVDRLETYLVKEYPYKRAVKFSYEQNDNDEPHVEAGGGLDLYGICKLTSTATVLSITNKFQGYLVAKQSSGIKRKDKLKFDLNSKIEKDSLNNHKINAIALSEAIKLDTEKKLCMVHLAICGNKGKPN